MSPKFYLVVVENCTVEDLDLLNYKASYRCGPGEQQTEVRVIEKGENNEVIWSYVVRPGGIMCKCPKFGLFLKYSKQKTHQKGIKFL